MPAAFVRHCSKIYCSSSTSTRRPSSVVFGGVLLYSLRYSLLDASCKICDIIVIDRSGFCSHGKPYPPRFPRSGPKLLRAVDGGARADGRGGRRYDSSGLAHGSQPSPFPLASLCSLPDPSNSDAYPNVGQRSARGPDLTWSEYEALMKRHAQISDRLGEVFATLHVVRALVQGADGLATLRAGGGAPTREAAEDDIVAEGAERTHEEV